MSARVYVMRQQGRKQEALTLLGEVVVIARDKLNVNHPFRIKFEHALEAWQRSRWDIVKQDCFDLVQQVLILARTGLNTVYRTGSRILGLLSKFFD